MAGPFLTGPLTEARRLFPPEFQRYPNSHCAKIELRYADCMQAYGIDAGTIKCHDLKEDFLECCFHKKSDARAQAMRDERARQYRAGERAEKYEAPPPRGFYIWP